MKGKHQLAEAIGRRIKGRVRVDAPMAALTTFRIGGPADLLVEPMGTEDLLRLTEILSQEDIEVLVMGRGSNLLVSDRGIRGLVIRIGRGLSRLRFESKDLVDVEAGCSVNRLVRETVRRGLGGIERLFGIPGSLGGAVRMNAGAFGQEIGERLQEAWVVRWGPGDQSGLFKKGTHELNLRYRDCDLDRNEMFLKFKFRFILDDPQLLEERRKEALFWRKERQPLGWPSAGSVFKNPPGMSAGELIERCGLKGKSVGDAVISEKHANFIINQGRATAAEVRRLMELAKEEVFRREGVLLEEEIRLVGEWGDDL